MALAQGQAEVRQQKLHLRATLFPCSLAVWNRIIEPVAAMRKEADMLRLFPEYLKGEELFGLTVHAVLRIAESVRRVLGATWAPGTLVPAPETLRLRQAQPVSTAAWSGELSKLFIPLRTPPPDGAATHDQSHWLCPIGA